jgi:hypothetical protein
MDRIYDFGFNYNRRARVVFPPLGKIWKSSSTAFTATTIT